MALTVQTRDKDGNLIYPITHTRAVFDDNGNSVENLLKAKADQVDTYTKAQVNNLIVPANTTIQVVESIPASPGQSNTIYRVQGTDSYSDYGWDGTQFIKLAEYNGTNLYDSIGQNTDGAMTQKAVADALLIDNGKILVNDFPNLGLYISPSTGKWASRSGYNGKMVPAQYGDVIKLTTAEDKVAVYAFLTSESHVSGDVPDFVSGTTVVSLLANDVVILDVPPTTQYLYVMSRSNSTDITPSLQSFSYANKNVESLNEIRWNEKKIDLNNFTTSHRYINSSSNKWGSNGSLDTKFIPIKPGTVVKLSTIEDTHFAFLKADNPIADSNVPSYAGGKTSCTSLLSGESKTLVAPSDAVYLYVCVAYQGEENGINVSILAPVNKEVDALSHIGQYMLPVEMLVEYAHSMLNVDGSIYYHETGEDGYTWNLCRKYQIEQGKEHYANARLGSNDETPAVAYYDSEGDFIGFDASFYPCGSAQALTRQKMTIPVNAASVIIKGSNYNVGVSRSPMEPALYVGEWEAKRKATPYVIEYHEAKIRSNNLICDKDTDPTSATGISDTLTPSGWAVMWPSSYTPKGKPTQVIAMLHGHSGLVNENVMGYYNHANWKAWMYKYLSEGYAVIDINGYGVTSGTSANAYAKHWGCPMAVETLDKAFEYLKANYNVADKMLLHGSSMGGTIAQNYAMAYPNKVAAVGLFAPATSIMFAVAADLKDEIVSRWGYADSAEAKADNYHNIVGTTPLAKCLAWKDGALMEVQWDEIANQSNVPSAILDYDYIEHFPVPLRVWQGTSDESVPVEYTKKVVEGYRRGGSMASLRLVQGKAHNMCTGSVDFVVEEAVAWYKRMGV